MQFTYLQLSHITYRACKMLNIKKWECFKFPRLLHGSDNIVDILCELYEIYCILKDYKLYVSCFAPSISAFCAVRIFYFCRICIILIEKPFCFRSNLITTIFSSRHSWDTSMTTVIGYELWALKIGLIVHIRSGLSYIMNVDYWISFLSPYLKSHGFLFKILIKMRPISIDGAILIWVFHLRNKTFCKLAICWNEICKKNMKVKLGWCGAFLEFSWNLLVYQ